MKNSVFLFEAVPCKADGMLDGERTGVLGIPMFKGEILSRAKEVLQSLDRVKYFGILELSNNTALEKISWQIYKSPDYWDVLLLVNDIDRCTACLTTTTSCQRVLRQLSMTTRRASTRSTCLTRIVSAYMMP